MRYEWDPAKEEKNLQLRKLSLALAEVLFAGAVNIRADDRFDYGETRQVAFGRINGRLYVCVFTDRGEVRRVISLRKANGREEARYGQSLK